MLDFGDFAVLATDLPHRNLAWLKPVAYKILSSSFFETESRSVFHWLNTTLEPLYTPQFSEPAYPLSDGEITSLFMNDHSRHLRAFVWSMIKLQGALTRKVNTVM